MAKLKASARPESVALDKKKTDGMHRFIDGAKPEDLTSTDWSAHWTSIHGEGRANVYSASKVTLHIGIRRGSGDGHYVAAIMCTTKVGSHSVPVEGTVKDFGTTEPSLIDILNHFKREFGKEEYRPPLAEDANAGGERPAQEGPQEERRGNPIPDGQGGFMTFLDNEAYPCDKDGLVPGSYEDRDSDQAASTDETEA